MLGGATKTNSATTSFELVDRNVSSWSRTSRPGGDPSSDRRRRPTPVDNAVVEEKLRFDSDAPSSMPALASASARSLRSCAGSLWAWRISSNATGTDSSSIHWDNTVDLPYPAGATNATTLADSSARTRRIKSPRTTVRTPPPARLPFASRSSAASVRLLMATPRVPRDSVTRQISKKDTRAPSPGSVPRPTLRLKCSARVLNHPVRAMSESVTGDSMSVRYPAGCQIGLQGG